MEAKQGEANGKNPKCKGKFLEKVLKMGGILMEKVLKIGGVLMEKVLKIGSVLTEKVLKSKEYDTKDNTFLLVWRQPFA